MTPELTCPSARAALRRWSPDDDLPDAVALHLDDCPECMDAFDARFPPVMERPRRRWAPLLAAAALALAVVTGVATHLPDGDTAVLELEPPVCIDLEVWFPPECQTV